MAVHYHFYKAVPSEIHDDPGPADIIIELTTPIPDGEWRNESSERVDLAKADAELLFKVLDWALPNATYRRLKELFAEAKE